MAKVTVDLCKRFTGIDTIPDNLAEYMMHHYCNLQANIGITDVEQGYGVRIEKRIRLMLPFKKCNRCGYHSLWNPDDSKSKCLRHTYTNGWDTVFSYNPDCGVSLEEAFSEFISLQSADESKPVVALTKN